jgi:four helix bundle protein
VSVEVEKNKKFLSINDLEAYVIAFNLSNYLWDIVIKWKYFERDTVGKQFTESVDSISANIAEGFGRYGKKDKVKFYRIAMGSTLEAIDWNNKSDIRKLLTADQFEHIKTELGKLPKSINSLIFYTNKMLTL